ncbi:MAG: AraC family transcriptional regulator [Oscillospiraceae bacterium]|nr:AraC family transcriptional regulator [Oscillospiraceae bacterium]
MNTDHFILENFSVTADIGVTVLDTSGEMRYASSVYTGVSDVVQLIRRRLDCGEADRVALLYGCYQARRFGGRYVFFTPSGLAYCASFLTGPKGSMRSGVLAGPFLMTDYDEYLEIDVSGRHQASADVTQAIRTGLHAIPIKTPAQARAISEQLYVCASYHSSVRFPGQAVATLTDAAAKGYSIEKEDELLAAISIGDIQTANALLNDILGQVLFHSGGDLNILRSRVVELTVLLSRASLRGGANIDAIFGLNYSYLREIDALKSPEDIILWLHGVSQRFAQHMFEYADSRHTDVIHKALLYIKQNYADKITLQDVADHVYLSPSYFSKVFKEETGQTPSGFITAVRIDISKKLLRDPSVSLVDIAELTGFKSQSYFTQLFKKAEGQTPGEYRRRNRHG